MSSPSRVRVSGPLVGHAAGFRADLEAQGYRRNTVANQLQLFAHVSRWLESKGLGPQHLTRERVAEFLSARRSAGYTLWLSEKGVAPLLRYLRSVGAAPAPEAPVPVMSADRVLEEFRSYLVHNVTRWRDGQMVLRWTAADMLNAERSFRRIKGYKQMPQLVDAPAPTRQSRHRTCRCRRIKFTMGRHRKSTRLGTCSHLTNHSSY